MVKEPTWAVWIPSLVRIVLNKRLSTCAERSMLKIADMFKCSISEIRSNLRRKSIGNAGERPRTDDDDE